MRKKDKNTRANDWPPLLTFVFAGIVLLFTTIAILSTFFRSELVQDRYYSEGPSFDIRRSQVEHTGELASELDIVYSAPANLIMIQFPSFMDPGTIHGTVKFYRPASEAMDTTIQIQPNVDLNQVISTSDMTTGLWLVKVEWSDDEREYFYEVRVNIE